LFGTGNLFKRILALDILVTVSILVFIFNVNFMALELDLAGVVYQLLGFNLL